MTGSGNWTYLVRGPSPVLVDAGVGQPEHLAAIASAVPGGPRAVLVTHAHPDHASGAGALAARWPAARLAKYPWPERDARYHAHWRPLAAGESVDTGETRLTVVHTPGHAPDHVALWDAASRTLFSGDLVVAGSTVVIPASAGGDLLDYLESLRRVLALDPARLLPAHGPTIDDPQAVIQAYLRHRQEREDQVLTALDDGRERIDAIADVIYVGLLPALVPMARESVLAHLVKLEREGRVRRDGDRWRASGR
jgi:glyoxylase-like metal-dependent hydrolase (beta-lactamase superfamily II)